MACSKGVDYMIYGKVKNINTEKALFSDKIQKGLEYILNSNFAELAPGKYEIDGDDIYATVADYETEPKGHKLPEAHRRYIDIQYIALGEEYIGCSFLTNGNEVLDDYNEEKDLVFYKNVINETDIKLQPDVYSIFLPSDVHRPGCASGLPGKVRKVVVKVKVD